jgi:hypothetical protein
MNNETRKFQGLPHAAGPFRSARSIHSTTDAHSSGYTTCLGRISAVIVLGAMATIFGGAAAYAQSHAPLQYYGGPVLKNFQIFPLYYGNWSNKSDIDAQQAYLQGLAAYISGENAPSGQQPMMKQYGVNSATVAAAKTSSAPFLGSSKADPSGKCTAVYCLTNNDLLNIIHTNQSSGNLPAYGPNTLTMVFPSHGFGVVGCNGCGYHASETDSSFWAVVPQDAGPSLSLVSAHEVFEAAAAPDPATNQSRGWDEAVDGCSSIFTMPVAPYAQVPGATDNTQGGSCSTSGYTSLSENQDYGVTYSVYLNDYNRLWPQGWRLYSLQSYVVNGQVLYNAVWRPGNGGEIQVYGWTYASFRSEYDQLWPQGWRLYILQSYVLNGQVLYNAVWRPGNTGEIQAYGCSYANFRSQYDQLWQQGWRLYILQSYVLNGQVLYNAVWRPGNTGEIQVYGGTYSNYVDEYNQLWSQGWRLYLLDTYVLNGQVFYNAVWRPNTSAEDQVYGWSNTDYRTEYDKLWQQGMRLYILQSYVMPNGQVLYNAVWRPGTLDRPL